MPRYAAIDIGSNSIRMEAADVVPGQPVRILASDREVTRLGESVFRAGRVSPEAMTATCEVLARMAAQCRKLEVTGARAVATSAIRDARNQREFLERAANAAGIPVEVVSGREEARLIHLGVDSVWPHPGKRVLLIDIGGGSAEIIGAYHGRVEAAFSRPLGAVRLRELFLHADPATARELEQMREYIEEKTATAAERLAGRRWDRAIATSATAAALASATARIPRARREEVDRQRIPLAALRQLYRRLSAMDLAARRKITGIGPRRSEIIVPGVAVLLHFMEAFRLPSVYYSRAGVRDGIIADLAARNVGAEHARLSLQQREEVEAMARRFGASLAHGRRVAQMVHALFMALEPVHRLPPDYGKLLEAAAYLHDTGHFINSASHHKHSYYLVAHSDMAGFTAAERLLIAGLCRYHRKALPNPAHEGFQTLSAEDKRVLLRMIPILRLADSLDSSHAGRIAALDCRTEDGRIALGVTARGNIDLELWAAERTAPVFREVYDRSLTVARARG